MEEDRKKAEAAAQVEEEKKKKFEEEWENKKDQWEQDKQAMKDEADMGVARKPGEKLIGGDTGPLAHVGEGSETGLEEAVVITPASALWTSVGTKNLVGKRFDATQRP